MTPLSLTVLLVLFFITSAIGVVTGSNSLITVPVMFAFGIDEKIAIATNMFGLTFMAAGGAIPFIRQRRVDLSSFAPIVVLTVIGSMVGAACVGLFSGEAIRLLVSFAIISVVLLTLFRRKPPAGNAPQLKHERPHMGIALMIAVGVLSIYGGLYSGGYVTLLTAVLVSLGGMSTGGSIAATKIVNLFSSLVATLIFMWQGLVDYRLGAMLAVAMFAGAYIGAHFASRMNEIWLERIFLAAALLLAFKTLIGLF